MLLLFQISARSSLKKFENVPELYVKTYKKKRLPRNFIFSSYVFAMNPRPRPRPRPRVHAAFSHEQWANRPCGLMYRTIFFFTNSCEPELAHRLQTSKMRRNSTSLDRCQHDDINIVTVIVPRRRWAAPLKPRRPCVKHFTTFYDLKHVSPKGDYFTPKGHFLRPIGPLFCALVRELAIFAVCKQCENEVFACMCKEK